MGVGAAVVRELGLGAVAGGDDRSDGVTDDGATAAGLQAVPATTTAAAAKAILSVLFTDEPSAPTKRAAPGVAARWDP